MLGEKILKKVKTVLFERAKNNAKKILVGKNSPATVTPDKVQEALASYKNGKPDEMLKLIDEAKTDLKIKGVIGQLRSSISTLKWDIEAGKSDLIEDGFVSNQEDIRKAKISHFLIKKGHIQKLFKFAFNAALNGHTAITWDWKSHGDFYYPDNYKSIDSRHFLIEDEQLLFQQKEGDPVKLEGSNYVESIFNEEEHPIMIPATIAYFIKQYILDLWQKRIALHGSPFRWGKYSDQLDPENPDDAATLDVMMEGLSSFGEDCWAVFPEGMDVEFKESIHHSGDHKSLVDYLDEMISISIVHQNLTSMVKNGSRSAITTHETQLVTRVFDIATGVISRICNRVLVKMETMNFQSGASSNFSFIEPLNKDKVKIALEVAKIAQKDGKKISKEFYKQYGLILEGDNGTN
jgi:phage gp29-like protein